jgi:SEC-C motif-containing protein
MRSRYTAYVLQDIDYLKKTLWPEQQKNFDSQEVKAWSKNSQWLGLEVLRTEAGSAFDNTGVVEFVAKYILDGSLKSHQEVSQFRRGADGRWYYVQQNHL